jgi:parvulin-like peptidyl-prolyl isomerase
VTGEAKLNSEFIEEFKKVKKEHGLRTRQKDHYWPDSMTPEENLYIEKYFKRMNKREEKKLNTLKVMTQT